MDSADTSALQLILDNLEQYGSWLFDGITYGLNYDKLFDPTGWYFEKTPTRQKLLEFKEYKFCGLPPERLSAIYWAFCKQEQKQDLYADLGHALLQIIDSITPEDVSDLDIHDLSNWYRGREENPETAKIHFVIKSTLADMSPKLHRQLIDQKDLLIRKRIILMHYSVNNCETKVVKNDNPILDRIDEELLSRVDTYKKNDIDHRTLALEQLVWDLYEEMANLDTHDPLSLYNRYMDTESDSHPLKMHDVIRRTLVDMSPHLHQLLIDEKDNQARRRLVLMHNSMKNSKTKIVKNADPIFDRIDEELLSRVGLLDKEDGKARYIALKDLVEDLHDEFDPAYKQEKQEYAQRLVACIEGLQVEELKTMREFSSYNLENVLQAKKNPKEWLYSKVTDEEIWREVEKIRPRMSDPDSP